MKDKVIRKCHACGEQIHISRSNITGVLMYKNFYYHTDCFIDTARERASGKTKTAAEWANALNNLDQIEAGTIEALTTRVRQSLTDDLNTYLIETYDIVTMSGTRFWQVVGDLGNGIYKGKRCKKVPIDVLLETWEWYQQKLDETDRWNKANHRGPKDGKSRILYDFAIVVGQVSSYLTYKEKQRVAELERQCTSKETLNIDYSKIKAHTNNTNGLDDISDILDEF